MSQDRTRRGSALLLMLLVVTPVAAQLDLSCPEPVRAECDGAGNVADRAAWLAAFTAQGGCQPVATLLESLPGIVLESAGRDLLCDTAQLTINGAAAGISNPVDIDGRCGIRLTDALWQSSSVFLTDPLDLAADASFSTRFAFRIPNPLGTCLDLDGAPGADGIVFVLQAVSNTAGGLGGEIGYGGLGDSLGVEFDTWENRTVDDGDTNHVGIDLDGDMDSVVQAHVVPDFNDGRTWHVFIDYDGVTDLLEVRVSMTALRPTAPTITHVVDLPSILGSTRVFPGFTSGTGCAGGWHEVFDWQFDIVRAGEPCPVRDVETVIFSAEDACGNWQSCRSTFTVADTMPPDLIVPLLGDCYEALADAEAAVRAGASAHDACDGDLPVTVTSVGGCNATVSVSAIDACGHASTQAVPVTIDAAPPTIAAPADRRLRCDEALPHDAPAVLDDCDPDPRVTLVESRVDGECPGEYVLTRRWDVTDRCGHFASARQMIHVTDDEAPLLLDVPGDVTVECDAVPPAPVLRAADACDPAPRVMLDETQVPGRCASEYDIIREWTAMDACGNVATARQVVHVVDTTPPHVWPGPANMSCLWPPNHWMVCFDATDFSPIVRDACGGDVTWRFEGCASDQPEDDRGDGHFAPDCVVAPDGSAFCVRAERQGTEPGGRHHAITIVAADACGNMTEPVSIGEVYVPHDQAPHESCLKTTVVGIKHHEPLPF